MRLDLSKIKKDAEWHRMGDADDDPQILIELPRASQENWTLSPEGNMVVTGPDRLKKFMRAAKDWKGFEDTHGLELPCNDESKKLVFDMAAFDANALRIVNFVFTTIGAQLAKHEAQEKNLNSGRGGSSQSETKPPAKDA